MKWSILLCDDIDASPAVGDRISVYWQEPEKWYAGTIRHLIKENGTLLHEVWYDAGDKWIHDLADTDNKWKPAAAAAKGTAARIMMHDALTAIVRTRKARRARAEARRLAPLMALLESAEYDWTSADTN